MFFIKKTQLKCWHCFKSLSIFVKIILSRTKNDEKSGWKTLNTLQFPFEIFTIAEVGEQIRLKDTEASKRWCQKNEVPVYKLSSRDCVYKLDLYYALSKPFVLNIQKTNPLNWKELLKEITPDLSLYNYFLLKLGEPRNNKAFKEVLPANVKEKNLLNSILS